MKNNSNVIALIIIIIELIINRKIRFSFKIFNVYRLKKFIVYSRDLKEDNEVF